MTSLTTKFKEELEKYGLEPKKSLGQNFLVNEKIYENILSAAEVKGGNNILEIGPGLGTLTEYLASKNTNIIAVEKDRNLAKILKEKYVDNKCVHIVEDDILKFILENENFKEGEYKIIGNIPYYLTSHLLRIIFTTWPRPKMIVFLVQKELAERIISKPPRANMLSVSVQYFSEPKIMRFIGKGNFWPQPKIDSALIRMNVEDQKRDKDFDKKFFQVVKSGFSNKRKQLVNNLSSSLGKEKIEVTKLLEDINIDSKRRAETLSIKEWEKIVKQFY